MHCYLKNIQLDGQKIFTRKIFTQGIFQKTSTASYETHPVFEVFNQPQKRVLEVRIGTLVLISYSGVWEQL